MKIKIEIEIETNYPDEFSKYNLERDIQAGFEDITGFEVRNIEIEEIEEIN